MTHNCFFVFDRSEKNKYIAICRGCGTIKVTELEVVKAKDVLGLDFDDFNEKMKKVKPYSPRINPTGIPKLID